LVDRGTGTGFLDHQLLVACGAHLAPVFAECLPRAEVLIATLARGVVAEPDRSSWKSLHLLVVVATIVRCEARDVNWDVVLRPVP
jgi:hypothetical protein